MKSRVEATRMVPKIVLLDVTTEIEPKPKPVWVPTLAVGPNIVMVCGEGG